MSSKLYVVSYAERSSDGLYQNILGCFTNKDDAIKYMKKMAEKDYNQHYKRYDYEDECDEYQEYRLYIGDHYCTIDNFDYCDGASWDEVYMEYIVKEAVFYEDDCVIIN